MFNHQTKTFIRRPHVRLAQVPNIGGRVRVDIHGVGVFDLEPGEAMTLANYLVDMAEEVTTGEAA